MVSRSVNDLRCGLTGMFKPPIASLRRPWSSVRAPEMRPMAVDLSMPILVVDDYNTMIRIIRNLLRQLGFENVDDATDGSRRARQDARQAIRPGDLRLEHGADDRLRPAQASARRSAICATTPFIMVTAESKTENVIAAKKAGVNNYIVKPFNAQTLKNKIEAVFADAPLTTAAADHLPAQLSHHRLRRSPASANIAQRAPADRHASAELLGMDAGGHEQAIDAEGVRALEIGAHRIADRQHALARRRRRCTLAPAPAS